MSPGGVPAKKRPVGHRGSPEGRGADRTCRPSDSDGRSSDAGRLVRGGALEVVAVCAATAQRVEVDSMLVTYRSAVLPARQRLEPVESARPGGAPGGKAYGHVGGRSSRARGWGAELGCGSASPERALTVERRATAPPRNSRAGCPAVGNYGPMTLTHHRIKTTGSSTTLRPASTAGAIITALSTSLTTPATAGSPARPPSGHRWPRGGARRST